MARFSKSLKSKILSSSQSHQKELMCCSFSILMNSIDLDSLSKRFNLIINVFLTQNQTILFQQSYEELINTIRDRPLIQDFVRRVISKPNKSIESDQENSSSSESENEIEEEQIDESIKIKSSIKSSSPFTKHFNDIFDNILNNINHHNTKQKDKTNANNYYNESFCYHLLENFMPYCFIWSSLVLNGTDIYSTRWTNGCIEKFIHSRKRVDGTRLNQPPAEYTNYVYPLTIGACKEYSSKKTKKVKRKIQNENEQTPAEALDGFKATSSQRDPLIMVLWIFLSLLENSEKNSI